MWKFCWACWKAERCDPVKAVPKILVFRFFVLEIGSSNIKTIRLKNQVVWKVTTVFEVKTLQFSTAEAGFLWSQTIKDGHL